MFRSLALCQMRIRPSRSLRRQVLAFYGPRCVLCGAPNPDLSHIIEVNSETTFENLLPLCANTNKEMRLAGGSCYLQYTNPTELLVRVMSAPRGRISPERGGVFVMH